MSDYDEGLRSAGAPEWSVTGPGWQDEPMRTIFHDWLRDHDLDPNEVRYVETDVVDIPLLRAEILDLDADGLPFLRAGDVAVRTREVALKTPPPVWSWP